MPSSSGYLTVEWSDFQRGEYGSLGGAKAPAGTFHANNMLVTTDGYLVPRSGLGDITPTGMPTGKLLGFAQTDTPGADGLFIIGNTVYLFDLFNTAVAPTSIGTLSVTPSQIVNIRKDATKRIFAVPGDGVYSVDPTVPSLTKLTGSPGGTDVDIYDDQLIVAHTGNQVDASKPGDYTDWTEGRFANIGDNWQVTVVREIRNALAILKREGIHLLTGVLGDPNTQVIRKVSLAQGPLLPQAAERDQTDIIWFWPAFRNDIGYFNGATVGYTSHIGSPTAERDGDTAIPPLVRGVTAMRGDLTPSSIAAVVAGSTQFMALQHNGIWTYHSFGTTVSGLMIHDPDLERLVITDGGDTGVAAKMYSMYPQLNRPVIASDTLVNYGDGTTTPLPASVTFPQYWVAPYRRYPVPSVRIRQIVVDFKKYDTGNVGHNNHFDVVISSLGRNAVNSVTHTFGDSFDEVPGSSSTLGTVARKTCNLDMEMGGGFEVTLNNVVGLGIKSVTCHFEMDDKRPSA